MLCIWEILLLYWYGRNDSIIWELQQLTQLLAMKENKHGLLHQIFIPKDLVDSQTYVSIPYGNLERIPDKVGGSTQYYEKPSIRIPYIFSKQNYIPSYMDYIQARMLINSNLSYKNGVKIFRHYQKTSSTYAMKKMVNDIVKKVISSTKN